MLTAHVHTNAAELKDILDLVAHEHHAAEKRLPKHEWSVWYSAFMVNYLIHSDTDRAVIHADAMTRQHLDAERAEAERARVGRAAEQQRGEAIIEEWLQREAAE